MVHAASLAAVLDGGGLLADFIPADAFPVVGRVRELGKGAFDVVRSSDSAGAPRARVSGCSLVLFELLEIGTPMGLQRILDSLEPAHGTLHRIHETMLCYDLVVFVHILLDCVDNGAFLLVLERVRSEKLVEDGCEYFNRVLAKFLFVRKWLVHVLVASHDVLHVSPLDQICALAPRQTLIVGRRLDVRQVLVVVADVLCSPVLCRLA